jgi:hypothetical protein
LVTFLCPTKEKSPAVGQPPTSNTRAKPARQIILPLSLSLSRKGRGDRRTAEYPTSMRRRRRHKQ